MRIKAISINVDSSQSKFKNKRPVVTENELAFLFSSVVSLLELQDTVRLNEELEKRQKQRNLADTNAPNVTQQVLTTRKLSRIVDR